MSAWTPGRELDPLPPGSEACGCCEGVDPSTPQRHPNRHGLSAVTYRIGRHSEFRDSLLAGLSDSQFAPLDRLLTREADDFTLGLIDAFACSADVLTFYQERLANESWLRTATERVSLQEMGRLIGYRLRPGVAAETTLAFAVEPARTPPPGASADPGSFVTGIPDEVVLPVGLKVQSVPGPDERPQAFETVETVRARPEWNAIRPWLALPRLPAKGDRHLWLQGAATGLKPGDALLIVGSEFEADPGSERWDLRILSEVSAEPEHDRTRVAWKRPLGSIRPAMAPSGSGVRVFALRTRAGVFGHNAPMWRTMPAQFKTDYQNEGPSSIVLRVREERMGMDALAADWSVVAYEWPDFVISPAGGDEDGGHVDLDAAYPTIAPGGYAVLARGSYDYPDEPAPAGTYLELFRVDSVSEISREEFAVSGKSTRLRLIGENYALFSAYVRGTRIFAQSEELTLAPHPVTDAVGGAWLPATVPATGLEAGRRLVVRGVDGDGGKHVHDAVLIEVAETAAGHSLLRIDPPLPRRLRRESVHVYANVARARHGESVTQILGSGDAGQAHQGFELKQAPLTWRSAANELGAESELTLRVGGIEWTARSSLYGAGASERVYTLDMDEAGRQWLHFGDGEHGARLPSGNQNVRASYRKGLGREGNVRAETLTQLMSRPLGLKSVANPTAAQGGTDPEPAAQARASMPLGTRTLGRAVSLLDYEDFARAYTGVAKAQAAVLRLRHGPVVALTLASQDGMALTPANPVWVNLRDALLRSGDPRVQVRLLGYQASTFRLGMKVKVHPDHDEDAVLAAVEQALRGAFCFAERALAQPVQQSEVIAVAHRVPGVVAVDLDFLFGGTRPAAQTRRSRQWRLLASQMRVDGGTPLASELLTLHPGPLERLEPMT